MKHQPDSVENLTKVLVDSFSDVTIIPVLPSRANSVLALMSIELGECPSRNVQNVLQERFGLFLKQHQC